MKADFTTFTTSVTLQDLGEVYLFQAVGSLM